MFSMMRLGSAVQTKGLGLRLCSPRYRLIAAWRSTSERKTPRCNRRRVSVAKKVSTALAQEQEVGVKWNIHRGCRASQARTLELVSGLIVEDRVDQLAGGHDGFDPVQETDELLVAMPRHALADHAAVEDIECGKQRGRAVPDVVVSHCPGPPFLHRQARLGTHQDSLCFNRFQHQSPSQLSRSRKPV